MDAFLKDTSADGLRKGGRSPAGVAGLRRAHGRLLAGRGPLLRERRVPGRLARPAVLAVSRLGDRGLQPQHAVRPVLHLAAGRRPAARATRKEQKLATAFLRVGKRTTENGAIDEEYRVEYAVDRTNTIGTAFLGPDGRLRPLPRPQVRPDQPQGLLLAVRLLQQHRRARLLRAGQHRHHRRADASTGPTPPRRRSWRRPTRWSASARRRLRRGARGRRPRRRRRRPRRWPRARRAQPPRCSSRWHARPGRRTTPFEETAPIPDDKLPDSRPRRRMPPPLLAPLTAARNPFGQGAAPGRRRPPLVPRLRPARTGRRRGDQQLQQAVRQRRNLPSDLVRDALVFTPERGAGRAGPGVARGADPQGRRQGQGVLLRRHQPRRAGRTTSATSSARSRSASTSGCWRRRSTRTRRSSTTARTTTSATPATSCSSRRTGCASTSCTRAPATGSRWSSRAACR